MDCHRQWIASPAARHEKWLKAVLANGAEWADCLVTGPDVPSRLTVQVPEHRTEVHHWGVLFAPDADKSNDVPIALVHSVPGLSLRGLSDAGWSASPIDRMAIALRRLGVPLGLVTNGKHWAIVWAEGSYSTGSAIFDSTIWAEEKLFRDAFFALMDIRRFVGVAEDERLPALLKASLLQQEEITEELGRQVRQAVELIVQSFSESRIHALSRGQSDPLPQREREPYEAAVTLMMRIVFMLFAEERGLLPISEELYSSSYAISTLLDELEEKSRRNEEQLDSSTEAWHRLLSTSEALYFGASFEDMRMPAYGGSLFDASRFSWLSVTDSHSGLQLAVSDRVVLHVLRSIQVVKQAGYARRISFREVDVEQIGYIYEGLLGYTSKYAGETTIVGLTGSAGDEPEIDLSRLVSLRQTNPEDDKFVDALVKELAESQPGSKPSSKNKLLAALKTEVSQGIAVSKLGSVTGHNQEIIEQILPLYNLLRTDLRELPYVVPPHGVVVTETRSRKNAGAHYTPRALAEEVVLHALEPLVYAPGPLQTEDRSEWKLKNSAEILDLKVADIAVGSGAFLVAAARYLSERLVDAWQAEGIVSDAVKDRNSEDGMDPLSVAARREVIARCLYGADINEMAVEMCKLSLWLISLDPGKPFSFLDDKVLHGNSLLGLTSVEQLEYMHIAPTAKQKNAKALWSLDVQGPLNESIRLRQEIAASPVDDFDAHRSAAHKSALLRQSDEITAQLREVADGVVAAGLIHGGKPGVKLDQAYHALSNAAFNAFDPFGSGDRSSFDAIVDQGLTPTVATDYERWQPLHWILEVPEVMERGGFDAIIGNPPFLVSKNISGAVGGSQRDWLIERLAGGRRGTGDLVVFFLNRAACLLNPSGALGLVTAKVISEGDSRYMGLEYILDTHQGSIYRSMRNRPWPGVAATNYSLIWYTRNTILEDVVCFADEMRVSKITAELLPADQYSARPGPLSKQRVFSCLGSYLLGDGFQLSRDEATSWLADDSGNENVLFPYVNGSNLGATFLNQMDKWAIDFGTMTENEASRFTLPFSRLQQLVEPERRVNAMKSRREHWWRHAIRPNQAYEYLDTHDFAVAIPFTSKYGIPAVIRKGAVYSSALILLLTDDYADYAFLSSTWHHDWAARFGGRMKSDLRYTPSDVLPILPWPEPSSRLRRSGETLWQTLGTASVTLGKNLTGVMNHLISDPNSEVSKALGSARLEVDQAVLEAYGFPVVNDPGYSSEFLDLEFPGPSVEVRYQVLELMVAENLSRVAKENAYV